MARALTLQDIFLYPVKSLRGCRVDTAAVDDLGLVGDRRFMVVDPGGRFLSQRTLPRMALIETALAGGTLRLAAAGAGSCTVPAAPAAGGVPRTVSVWKSEGLLADDAGDEAAAWLGGFLGLACRLVRIGPAFRRPILKPDVAGPGDLVSFADAFPFLALGTASLADLNDRLAARGGPAVPMNRFRPNLVIAGGEPFAEDTWTRFQVGEIVFHAAGPCARCVITTTDQATAERGPEPLRTLAGYRRNARDPGDVDFGQNLIHETKRGTLRTGDAVRLLA